MGHLLAPRCKLPAPAPQGEGGGRLVVKWQSTYDEYLGRHDDEDDKDNDDDDGDEQEQQQGRGGVERGGARPNNQKEGDDKEDDDFEDNNKNDVKDKNNDKNNNQLTTVSGGGWREWSDKGVRQRRWGESGEDDRGGSLRDEKSSPSLR